MVEVIHTQVALLTTMAYHIRTHYSLLVLALDQLTPEALRYRTMTTLIHLVAIPLRMATVLLESTLLAITLTQSLLQLALAALTHIRTHLQ